MFWRELTGKLSGKFLSSERLAAHATNAILLLLIILAGVLLYQLVSRLLRRSLKTAGGAVRTGKRRTVVPLVNSVLRYVIGFVVLVLGLHQLGIDYAAILAGAGVVGLAVGFGAQTLIRDFLSGFFLIFEDLIEVGDYIEVGPTEGTIESIGLRTTQLRSFNGVLHTIPNGELTRLGNYNRGFCRAIVELQLPADRDAREIMRRIDEVAQAWAGDRSDIVLVAPQVLGLFDLKASGVTVKIVVKVKPQTHWAAERELRVRLKEALAQDGIALPRPEQIVEIRSPAAQPRP
jgi:small conductance mechanosensitive channel